MEDIIPMLSVPIILIIIGLSFWYEKADEKKKKREKEEKEKGYIDKLLELQKLKEKKIITEEEFEAEKEKIKPM